MTNHKKILANFLSASLIFSGIALAPAVLAAGDNVGGFAWSENVGWVSFNNSAIDGVAGGGGSNDYGVGIDQSTGAMSGYAWSENIGWVSFNSADVNGCNGCSGAACLPTVDTNADGSGNHAITGWARAIAAVTAGSNAGGWDGCLKFKNSYIDSNGDFYGWMTSSAEATTGVVGWVNLNKANCNGTNCTANASYKVHTSVAFGPVAAMECGGSCPGGYCDTDPDSTWEMYAPTGDCPTCTFTVMNTSSGDVQCTAWKLVGTTYGGAYDGKQNLTFLAGVPIGNYTLRLTVSSTPRASNNDDCSLGLHTTSEHLIHIKKEVDADFMCSLDDPAVIPSPLWIDCESDTFKKKVMKGERIFLSDAASLGLHSEESEDGSGIDNRNWTFNVDGTVTTMTGTDASFVAGKSNIIKLEVGDNVPRSNCQIINMGGKTLPKWQEVNPVGMIFKNLQASLARMFGLTE